VKPLVKPVVKIVAPSSVVPMAELSLGVTELKAAGFEVKVDPQVKKKDLFFAGSHADRADALIAIAHPDFRDALANSL
jgi:muramoyltetrapeptide carboxypeptidase LdcA involved in peptidoglycan recycling